MRNMFGPVLLGVALLFPYSLQAQSVNMPKPEDFIKGESWNWTRVNNQSKREEGTSARTVVDVGGELQFEYANERNGMTTSFTAGPYSKNPPQKPWRVWPLEVGKSWSYEAEWSRPDGVTGTTQQDAEVVAYEEVSVPAGKVMAYKIVYKGIYRNSRGNSGHQYDTYWYAPDMKADIRHIREDGYNFYTNELVSYKRTAP